MKARDGFTLIDVVVAAALLLLIVGGSLTMIVMGQKASHTVAAQTSAQQLAQGELEFLRQAPPTPPVSNGSCSLGQSGYTCTYNLTASDSVDLAIVTVTPPAGKPYTLESYILPP